MNSSTTNPAGTSSVAPSGFGTTVGLLRADGRGKRRRQLFPVHGLAARLRGKSKAKNRGQHGGKGNGGFGHDFAIMAG